MPYRFKTRRRPRTSLREGMSPAELCASRFQAESDGAFEAGSCRRNSKGPVLTRVDRDVAVERVKGRMRAAAASALRRSSRGPCWICGATADTGMNELGIQPHIVEAVMNHVATRMSRSSLPHGGQRWHCPGCRCRRAVSDPRSRTGSDQPTRFGWSSDSFGGFGGPVVARY
jgi:hypothetical protein